MTDRKLIAEPEEGTWEFTRESLCLASQVALDDDGTIHVMLFTNHNNVNPRAVIVRGADAADRMAMQMIEATRRSRKAR